MQAAMRILFDLVWVISIYVYTFNRGVVLQNILEAVYNIFNIHVRQIVFARDFRRFQ